MPAASLQRRETVAGERPRLQPLPQPPDVTPEVRTQPGESRRDRPVRDRRRSRFSVWRSISMDCFHGSNPLDWLKKLQPTFIGCRYIDGHEMHLIRCSFYLAVHFQGASPKEDTATNARRGRKSTPEPPSRSPPRRGGSTTGEHGMNTCTNCRHRRPHAGSPTDMVCGLFGSNNHSPIPCIILDLVHQKPADHPWCSGQRRAASAACCTRTSHRVPTASRSVSKEPSPHTRITPPRRRRCRAGAPPRVGAQRPRTRERER